MGRDKSKVMVICRMTLSDLEQPFYIKLWFRPSMSGYDTSFADNCVSLKQIEILLYYQWQNVAQGLLVSNLFL